MIVDRMEEAPARNSEMCQASTAFVTKTESDDEFKWEEFFGTSVDLTSTLLDMFDTIVAKNTSTQENGTSAPQQRTAPPPCDPGGGLGNGQQNAPKHIPTLSVTTTGGRPARAYSKRSYSDTTFNEKKRPLSSSSVSSSSSSSSSSLPRNSLDVKKSYLASIESLDDDDCDDDDTKRPSRDSGVGGSTGAPSVGGLPSGKPRWCDPNLSHTDRVILEIVDTEKTYVRDLNEIIEGYLKYISNAQETQIGVKCLQELFSNVEDIYKFNSTFVNELESCGLDPVAVARCFVKNSCGFEVYTQYCTNYPRTVSVLTELMGSSDTAEVFRERQMALQHSLPLGSYLLKPVQRILKYHLLLQNMVKHSDKDSDGYCDVKNALSVMTGIAYHINDMKRKHEHAVRVQEIQSLLYGWEGQDLTTYGELVAEGAFRMYRAKALRHLFLFDKMLLIAKKKEEGILSYKTHIMCSNLMLIESIQGEPLCFHVIPFDNPRFQYTFQARNVEQKREWCLQLKRVILENYNAVIPSHARQLVMELGQSKQEDSAIEKSTAKRPLSAPEYLEKRKQERRKSELNLNRTLKLKKNLKKGEQTVNKNSFAIRHHKNNQSDSQERLNGHDKSQPWTKSQEDMCHKQRWLLGRLGNKENISTSSSNSVSNLPFSRGTRVRHSLPEPSLNQRNGNRDRRFRPSWRTWNSVPEETTDTENEEIEGKKLLDYCPPPHTYRDRTYSEASEEAFDNSGEYVTFFHAHAYATRDMHNGHSDFGNSYSQERTLSDIEKSYENRHESEIMRSDDYSAKTEHQKDQDSESGSSVSSWKQSSAIRRVQSFTGMAKARVQSLHHNISFKYSSHSDSKGKSKKSSINLPPSGSSLLPSAPKETSPVAPAAWLKQQEEHLANGGKKSGSLPRSFQPGTDNSSETTMTSGENTCRMRMRLDGSRSVYGERPFTIASDKPSHADFGDDLDYVVLDYSQYTGTEYYFQPQNNGYEHDTTTGCTNTPAVSMENVHAIHPELKIYHQAASKYATLKHLFFHMGSKIAGLKATIVSPTSQDPISSELSKGQEADNNTNKDGFKRSGSHSSIKSENELSPKLFTAKLAHSVAKAYSSVMRHKKKHEIKITDTPMSKKNEKVTLGTYKSESSLIGARMAQPLESEYSVPKYILSPKLLKDLRPDSLFSESSNATSSSDGDKTGNPESCFHGSKLDDGDDSVSEASDTSADSYYERTFDEIENALAQDVFRDSAIYSDPEDADFSTVEKPRLLVVNHIELERPKVEDTAFTYQTTNAETTSPTSPKIMCARKVNQAILDRLRILEENVKFQNEEASAIISTAPSKPYIQKRLDLDKWGNLVLNKDIEESETSSEHSASTVNTVMESGTKMNGSINNKNAPPKVKGWVKHVVDKFQGEGQV